MKFRMDQEVICVNDSGWVQNLFHKILGLIGIKKIVQKDVAGPEYGDVVTIDGYFNHEYVYLKGYDQVDDDGERFCYDENCFVPVADISELQAILKEEPKFDA